MVGMPSILSMAIKYANNLGRIHLVERLSELEPQFKEQGDEREKNNEIVHENVSNNISNQLINAKQSKESSTYNPLPVSTIFTNINSLSNTGVKLSI